MARALELGPIDRNAEFDRTASRDEIFMVTTPHSWQSALSSYIAEDAFLVRPSLW